MIRIFSIILAVIVGIHGLIHLMGFAAYWPLAKVNELPYKTTLLNGRLDLGETGMRFSSLLWLLAAVGLIAAAIALALGKSWWAPLMLAATLLSLAICILDWGAAFRGAWIDVGLLLILGVVFGFRVQPAPFAAYSAQTGTVETAAMPEGLPGPVERYYRQIYGDRIPLYQTAIMDGRGTVRFMGVTMPARLRFIHQSGQSYRHYIETTFYGIPIFKVNERYLDGHAWLALPFGVVENDPGVDSAANQGLWAETFIYPAYLLSDPRLRWQAVDDQTARMYVPYDDGEQEFTVRFDPQTGLITRYETLRYRDEKLGMVRWWGDFIYQEGENGQPTLDKFSATWEDEGTPWLVARIEQGVFNIDVGETIQKTGP